MKKKRFIYIVLAVILILLIILLCFFLKKEEPKQGTGETETIAQTENTQTEQTQTKEEDKVVLAYPSENGSLHVDGTSLVDENGERVQLKGISTHGLSWYPEYVNRECFSEFRYGWGANVIRLAMYTAENGGYCTDGNREELNALVRNGIQYATEEDLYVIVDWHVLKDCNPNTYIDDSIEFFGHISAEYANYDNIIYEICNEPNGGTSWEDVRAYAKEVIPVIRKNDPDALILVGTPGWCQDIDIAAENPLSEFENVMYTLHYYAATHNQALRERMIDAIEAGLPIFVSEYGICDASGNGTIDIEQANIWVNTMDTYGISYVAWNLSNKNESSAMIASGCSKTSGFTIEDLSVSGRWLYGMLTGDELLSQNTGQNDSKEENTAPLQEAISITSNGIEVTCTLRETWQGDNCIFYLYDCSLKNVSGADKKAWKVTIPFSNHFHYSENWNGKITIDGLNLVMQNAEYNGTIKKGETISHIGFIISGDSNLTIQQ